MPKPWWSLPKTHPVRINREFVQARSALRSARAENDDSDPSAWQVDLELRGVDVSPSPSAIVRAEERYNAKRATWEAAGCPDANGKRTQPRKRVAAQSVTEATHG